MTAVQPNEYTLQGGNVTFTFVKHNFLGQPFVSYTEGGQTKSFFGTAVLRSRRLPGAHDGAACSFPGDDDRLGFSHLPPQPPTDHPAACTVRHLMKTQ